MSVVWTAVAVADLEAIFAYIAAGSEAAAQEVLGRIDEQAGRLRALPLRGRVVPELAAHGIRTYRELVLPPWRIVYRVDGSSVRIMAVLDARRNLEDLLLARLLGP